MYVGWYNWQDVDVMHISPFILVLFPGSPIHKCKNLPTREEPAVFSHMGDIKGGNSLVPRPHPLMRKGGLVTIERFLGCAKSD